MDSNKATHAIIQSLTSPWGFFRHEILYILWALMDVALVTPVALAFLPWARYWPPWQVALWLLFLMLIPFNISRITSVMKIPVERQQLIMVGALLITIFVSWRLLLYQPSPTLGLDWLWGIFDHFGESESPLWTRDLAIFLLTVFMWWRGISLVGRRIDFADVGFRLRTGALLAAVFVGGLASSQVTWPVTPFILLFFFATLASLALTRVEQVELNQSGFSFPTGPRWLISVFLVAFIVVFATGTLAGLAGGDAVVSVVGFLAPVWLALQFTTAAVVSSFSLMLLPFIYALNWLLQLLVSALTPIFGNGLDGLELNIQELETIESVEELSQQVQSGGPDFTRILTALLMVAVVLLVALTLGRYFARRRREALYIREGINPVEGMTRGDGPGIGRRFLNRLSFFRRWQAAKSIRKIYIDMCDTAAAHGHPRAFAETPLEYLSTLDELWLDNRQDTRLITNAYNKVRYGEIPETEEELDQIRRSWKNLASAELGDRTDTNLDLEVQRRN